MKKIITSLSCLVAATMLTNVNATENLPTAEYIITGGGLPIRQAQLEVNDYNLEKYSKVPEIKLITIHNTAEPYTAMQERTRVNTRENSVTSFHFAVDENEAVQILPDQTHGWHAGDGRGAGNMTSIGIEICRSQCIDKDGYLYDGAEANAVKLTAYLLKKYNLTVDDMRMHYDWTKKHCPHRILDKGSWVDFKNRVAEQLKKEGDSHKELRTVLATANHDMGGINIFNNSKTKQPKYNTMYGKDFDTIEELIVDLQKNKITEVTISSWVMSYDSKALMDKLAEAGIVVEAFYMPKADVPNWVRQNMVSK